MGLLSGMCGLYFTMCGVPWVPAPLDGGPKRNCGVGSISKRDNSNNKFVTPTVIGPMVFFKKKSDESGVAPSRVLGQVLWLLGT